MNFSVSLTYAPSSDGAYRLFILLESKEQQTEFRIMSGMVAFNKISFECFKDEMKDRFDRALVDAYADCDAKFSLGTLDLQPYYLEHLGRFHNRDFPGTVQ